MPAAEIISFEPATGRELWRGMSGDVDEAVDRARRAWPEWAGKPLPISATCFHDGALTIRLSGAEAGVRAAREKLGGESVDDGSAFWTSVREQTAEAFRGPEPLWRLSLRPSTPPLGLSGRQIIEWNGALRWIAPWPFNFTTLVIARKSR